MAASEDAAAVDEMYLVSKEVPLLKLSCSDAFKKLTLREKNYAHHMSQASWLGAKICLEQTSPEARKIFEMFQLAFSEKSYDKVEHEDEEEKTAFYNYVINFYGNLGNYLSFGDRKFIPRIPSETFEAILFKHAKKLKVRGKKKAVEDLWKAVKVAVYSLDAKSKNLGKPHEAVSTYYIGDVTSEDVEFISKFMEEKKLEAWNTRLAKDAEGNLEIRCAAFEKGNMAVKVEKHDFQGRSVKVRYGDYGNLLGPVVDHLKSAMAYTANATQKEMLKCYAEHFSTGELQKHKDSQIAWVKDVGPAVETNIGFIENYRDGYGERSEWEGLVSAVNRDQSKKFDDLVSKASELIPKLPWPKEFEKDVFQRPDFTALDVISFASSGIPVGINIPNYDDIRQNVGFKNVHLHNVLASRYSDKKDISFITAADQESFKERRTQAFEVQVGIHELLGHGSGKILGKDDVQGKNIPDPLNPGKTITKFYPDGATWSSTFKALASAYEECRAEAVGIYMCLEPAILSIFGYDTEELQASIIYNNWLNMVHAGLVGLEFYSPEAKKWGQAHMHARFAILNVLLNAGEGLVKLEVDEEKMDASVSLDRTKIATVGKKAVGDFLLKLQVLKATGDVDAGNVLFSGLTKVEGRWLKIREIVLKHKKPRPVYVQAHTVEAKPGKAELLDFTPTVKGMLLSMQYHFGETTVAQANRLLRGEQAAEGPKLRKPRFQKVAKLLPEASSLNLCLKVVSVPVAVEGVSGLSEVVVGDGSGVVTLTLRDADLVKALSTVGTPVTVRNGKVAMVKGFIRLTVDKWGKIVAGAGEDASLFDFEPLSSNDVSKTEYELTGSK
eukprot:gnl/TRDRNA2_/TRDRNA2_187394_c0_seq1.p1 gnl/TRDRNA2_/TRDRNA2_187394_c0~~gnl/TRDRNA2_/TRDRNA2_187394_c0_seq1.p1  ORF type:complete len:838 (-),score=237.02 gnl/TRDRNA2_/TRDRNA2_187394_c0_seq1:60-2573(-)